MAPSLSKAAGKARQMVDTPIVKEKTISLAELIADMYVEISHVCGDLRELNTPIALSSIPAMGMVLRVVRA